MFEINSKNRYDKFTSARNLLLQWIKNYSAISSKDFLTLAHFFLYIVMIWQGNICQFYYASMWKCLYSVKINPAFVPRSTRTCEMLFTDSLWIKCIWRNENIKLFTSLGKIQCKKWMNIAYLKQFSTFIFSGVYNLMQNTAQWSERVSSHQ